MRLIDADALMEDNGLKDATKYANKDAEQQAHSYSTLMLYEIADMIEDAPTVEAKPEWIPCSEKLPEKRYWCLALFKEPYTGFVGLPKIAEYLMGSHTAYTTKEGWIISNCTDREDVSSEYYKDLICVAWQPLPTPYNAKRGGKNERNTD